MEYNPYCQRYNHLQNVLKDKNIQKQGLSSELSWFDTTDISNLHYLLEGEESSKKKSHLLIKTFKKEIETLHAIIQEKQSHTKTLFNPLNWFDNEQKIYRKKINELKKELSAKNENMERGKVSLSEIEKSIDKYIKEIDRYKNFDRESVSDKEKCLGLEIASLEEEFKQVSELKNKVDNELQPVIEQINYYKSNIASAKDRINQAKSFKDNLESADNSYEKAMIHNNCADMFGEGSPGKVINLEERSIKKWERDLAKAKKRASKIGEKASRNITKIVIDGNNMCYEDGKFVGLKPLIKLTNELQRNYDVIIVFDSAIRSQTQGDDQNIRTSFNTNIKVHIVATAQLADETLLEIAADNKFCYIISNDRFGEYQEKDAVKSNRLIRHEIVDSKVIIHDLNVNLIY